MIAVALGRSLDCLPLLAVGAMAVLAFVAGLCLGLAFGGLDKRER